MEVLTLRHLDYHDKPIALLNTDGFYDPLLAFFAHLHREGFAHFRRGTLFHVADTPEDALTHLDASITPRRTDAISGA